jgi:predicted protein tyrosine phosphatase
VALLAQAFAEQDEAALFRHIADIRPQAWPNSRMIGFADAQLGREGRLLAGLKGHYARRLASEPQLGPAMQAGGRGAEVSSAG